MPQPLNPAQKRFQRAAMLVSAAAGLTVLGAAALGAHSAPAGLTSSSLTEAEQAPTQATAELLRLAHADFATQTDDVSSVSGTLGRGDTLSDLLIELGASPAEAHRALAPVFEADYIDPRRVRPGLSATLTFAEGASAARLLGVSLRSEEDYSVLSATNAAGDFEATKLEARLSGLDPFTVAGLEAMTTLAASLTVGLSAIEPEADPLALWQAASLEEEWQADQWGRDLEAQERRAKRQGDFLRACDFVRLARPDA